MRDNKIDDYTMKCIDCGCMIYEPNFYAQNALQRCTACNEEHRRKYNAEKARENRRKARERREAEKDEVKLLREQNSLLKAEIENLAYLVKAQREQIEKLCCPDVYFPTDREQLIESRRKKDII